jgi:hypothetical protein
MLEWEVAGKNTLWYQGASARLDEHAVLAAPAAFPTVFQGKEDPPVNPRRCLMPVPIISLDEHLRQFAHASPGSCSPTGSAR